MIIGQVNEKYTPTIPIDLRDRNRRMRRFEIPIDTGFEGFLMLPKDLIFRLGGTFNRETSMTLANERADTFEEYIVEVFWVDQLLEVRTLASENETLIGVYLLAESHIEIDLTPGGTVTISELPAS